MEWERIVCKICFNEVSYKVGNIINMVVYLKCKYLILLIESFVSFVLVSLKNV